MRFAIEYDVCAAQGSCVRADAEAEGYDLVHLSSPDGLEAAFAPQVGMTCCSLQHGGVELIGERYGLTAYAGSGVTMGMSLMHPWADRLSSWSYTACGTTVRLPMSRLLHTDHWGLPVNGVHPSSHAWVMEQNGAAAGPDRGAGDVRRRPPGGAVPAANRERAIRRA
jgi:hypothetical protein